MRHDLEEGLHRCQLQIFVGLPPDRYSVVAEGHQEHDCLEATNVGLTIVERAGKTLKAGAAIEERFLLPIREFDL
jgi:hypothetical protein